MGYFIIDKGHWIDLVVIYEIVEWFTCFRSCVYVYRAVLGGLMQELISEFLVEAGESRSANEL